MYTPLYQGPRGTEVIYYHPHEQHLMLRLSGTIRTSQHYKEAFTRLLQLVREKNCPRVILHVRDLQNAPVGGRAWLIAQFAPVAFQHVGRSLRVAFVHSENRWQQWASQAILAGLSQLGAGFEWRSFARTRETLAWLGSAGAKAQRPVPPMSTMGQLPLVS